jgi:hypothetical protein
MNLVKKSVIALAALIIVGASHAQQPASGGTASGRLGQRYAGASIGVADFKDTAEEFIDTSIGVNLPITKSVDLDFGYDYQWLDNSPIDLTAHSVDAGATVYTSWHGVKPFASASLAYLWSKASYAGVSLKDNDGFYGVSVGFEAPVGAIVLTPAIGYSDSFDNSGDPTYSYGVDIHHWFTSKFGARAAVSYSDYGSSVSSWNYRIGLRMKF